MEMASRFKGFKVPSVLQNLRHEGYIGNRPVRDGKLNVRKITINVIVM